MAPQPGSYSRLVGFCSAFVSPVFEWSVCGYSWTHNRCHINPRCVRASLQTLRFKIDHIQLCLQLPCENDCHAENSLPRKRSFTWYYLDNLATDCSVVKSTCYSSRGPEFGSQHPHLVAYNHLLLHLQGIQLPLLTSEGTLTHMAYTHIDTHIKIQTKNARYGWHNVFANIWRCTLLESSCIKLNVGFISKIKATCSEVTKIRLPGGKWAHWLSLWDSLPF